MTPIGVRLKQFRRHRKLSSRALAAVLGRSQAQIMHWEQQRRHIRAEDMPTIAAAVNVPILAFFDDAVAEEVLCA